MAIKGIIDGRQFALDEKYLKKYKVQLKSQELPTGDVICGKIIWELKTVSDLINSSRSKRLYQQVARMKESGLRPVVVITTANLYHDLSLIPVRYINRQFWGIIYSLLIKWEIDVIILSKSEFYGEVIKRALKDSGTNGNTDYPMPTIKKFRVSHKSLVMHALSAIPGVGVKNAKLLAGRFNNFAEIVSASVKKLESAGISEKKAIVVYEFFRKVI